MVIKHSAIILLGIRLLHIIKLASILLPDEHDFNLHFHGVHSHLWALTIRDNLGANNLFLCNNLIDHFLIEFPQRVRRVEQVVLSQVN